MGWQNNRMSLQVLMNVNLAWGRQMNILYSTSIDVVVMIMCLCSAGWYLALCVVKKRKIWRMFNILIVVLSIYGILKFTVFDRSCSDIHRFVWYLANHEDPIWEMGMNTFLFYPFGLSLTVLIGPWSILISFAMSVIIEVWQFFSGTGLAQGTDVLFNTLGCALGASPWILYFKTIPAIRNRIKKED